jgi:polyisoprenyl-phosphate glycosyltransferase
MKKFIILIPLYNDWKSVSKVLKEIDVQISNWDAEVSVFLVNDASTEKRPDLDSSYTKIKFVKIINMKKNRGHARCNAAGLKYIIEKENFDYVIVMDGDGEDRPEELHMLFNKSNENPSKTIIANRIKRSEGPFFKLLYEIHKILTFIFTGKLIKFGNYSCLPKNEVLKLSKEASIWSSFSGSVTKVIPDRISIPSIRGKRYFGPSQMNFINLLIHSFSIIAVFKISVVFRSILFLLFYLFFVYKHLSAITLFPILVIIIFVLLIIKISLRENNTELSQSLENIESIDILNDSNSR